MHKNHIDMLWKISITMLLSMDFSNDVHKYYSRRNTHLVHDMYVRELCLTVIQSPSSGSVNDAAIDIIEDTNHFHFEFRYMFSIAFTHAHRCSGKHLLRWTIPK